MVITPAAGVVHPVGALALGAISSFACYAALAAKAKLGYDDSLDCFGIHGIGSGHGVLLLAFFIRQNWITDTLAAQADWTVMGQFLVQLQGMGATIVYCGLATLLICFVVDKVFGFRASADDEKAGLDHSQHLSLIHI